ncbi:MULTISPECIES: hypothetical protein [Lactobacillaceae]|uniref:hypothetical protein n=1 Tax=Lactobacillaceae TaxID=33958 RepID=UPI00128C6130|nr:MULTISPECIES: hypothetical protein [Lactobacillaceae]MCK3677943.1 hypothetical protein [Lactiplantibacillus plantarum]MCT3250094.1 hypothetical protein [Lactiplantibacillus plantarum]MQB60100.1 hypothetical protein [Limosilactobacillus reuteri]
MEILELPNQEKSEYIRFLLLQLVKKYHVNVRGLSGDIGVANETLYRFMHRQRKVLSEKNLGLIESTLIDLYGPLLESEIRLHKPFIDDLKMAAKKTNK